MTSLPAALCLDLDDTLWPIDAVVARAEERLITYLRGAHPAVADGHDAGTMRALRMRMAAEHPERGHDFTWLRMEALRRQAQGAGLAPATAQAVAEEAFEVFFAARHEIEPYADVLPALERLAARFPLYALSNGNADLRRTPLGRYFVRGYSARELGVAKPHVDAFEAVRRHAAVPAAQVLHIGDDPAADMHGAREAGMRTAWIHRHARDWPDALPRADHEFADLGALADHLLGPQ